MTTKNPEQLTCISILVCDDIYRDEKTRKLVIVGTFNVINSPRFPCTHPRLRVLFTLTNGRGRYTLMLAVEEAASGRRIVEMSGPADVQNPLDIADIDVEMQNVTLPNPGKYWVQVYADGELVAQRPFVANLVPAQGTGPQGAGPRKA